MPGPRAATTIASIEEAALQLALEQGYDATTVDQICERAGISQRTFFNHFPVKEDALLGHDDPRIDEKAAREFILADGPVLTDVLRVIRLPDSAPERERMKVISTTPTLLAAQAARISAIDEEIRELVALRLGRQGGMRGASSIEEDAVMVTNLVGGVLRWMAMTGSDIGQATSCVRGVFDDAAGAAG
ncbi:MAG: TetR/AcrR family transcriptional regulator [Mycobacteriaceae bacterium]|uniref:TetR/AcrR family transcriptional regulator n=1 Tax=Corynebacterium sp. TaxID=1720 RepID=UPI003F9B94FE